MVIKYSYLGIIGILLVICFIFLISSPPSFALSSIHESSVQLPISYPIEKKLFPDVYYLTESNNVVPANHKPEYDLLTVKEREERSLSTALTVLDPYYEDKIVYLTFDDGPDPENTPLILNILNENNVKATFFIVGTEAEKYSNLVKQIYTEEHAIGNHTYNHVYRDLYQSATTYTEQLQHNDQIIKSIINARPRISRAPGGSAGHFTSEYWKVLKNEGYLEVGWNISSGDASTANAETILNNIIDQTNKNTFLWNHAILLMHDGKGHGETVKALPYIIKFYKDLGFKFRVINAATPPAW